MHYGKNGKKESQENFFHELAKLDSRHFHVIGMYALSKDSVRVRNRKKGKRKRNKKVSSRNVLSSQLFFEHIYLNSNNSNESFLSESSDTLKTILQINLICFCYLKLKLTLHFPILNSSQKVSECTLKIGPKTKEDFTLRKRNSTRQDHQYLQIHGKF